MSPVRKRRAIRERGSHRKISKVTRHKGGGLNGKAPNHARWKNEKKQ